MTIAASEKPNSPPPAGGRGPRLHFLDGLRGLASLYVLLFHESNLKVENRGELSSGMHFAYAWLNHGHFGVVFFIVLSGFSLMLPVARSGSTQLSGGFGNYVYRRARRILPPYYAALAGSIAIIVLYNAVGPSRGYGQSLDAALRPGSILSHLFLFHNLTFEWAYRINGPMWSVATEWQIYFVFALALLPLWRIAGPLPTVAIAWLVGSLPQLLLPANANFFWACPWFIGSFALGMAGAAIGFSPSLRDSALRNRVPWGALTLVCLGALAVICATGRAETWAYPVVDFVVSMFAFCWINACVQRTAGPNAERSLLLRVLGSRAVVYLGGFSYSLYLVQHPILRFADHAIGRLPLNHDGIMAASLLVGTPIIMAVAWVFSEFFERPFTNGALLLPAIQRRFGATAAPQQS